MSAGGPSMMDGWVPLVVQLVTVLALVCAIGWRTRRWRVLWLPLSVALAAAATLAVSLAMRYTGIAGEPAPQQLWLWTSLTGLAVGVLVFGWRGSRPWRRNASVFAASFCLLSTGLVINGWIGYFPTVGTAWNQLTGRPLPSETDLATAVAMRSRGERPPAGRMVEIDVGDAASGFRHRREWVYLPQAWFTGAADAPLPAVMMIGGEFHTPADWVRAGRAVTTADSYAAAHDGYAPVLVFVDASGGFTIDTECVNGVRGNAADHLTKDVVPFVASTFDVRPDGWGVAGFSSGGTCALDLAVMHPDLFGSFVDIAGDERPNAGSEDQTVDRLFGGDREAWSAFDPATVIQRHGPYSGLSGLFVVPDGAAGPDGGAAAADKLCGLGASKGIACTVRSRPGRHDWPFASAAFADAFAWLAGQLSAQEGRRPTIQ